MIIGTCVADWICMFIRGVNCMHWIALHLSGHDSTILRLLSFILLVNTSFLVVKHLSVQQQNGYRDCGLSAVAFAMVVCLGRNPKRPLLHMQER